MKNFKLFIFVAALFLANINRVLSQIYSSYFLGSYVCTLEQYDGFGTSTYFYNISVQISAYQNDTSFIANGGSLFNKIFSLNIDSSFIEDPSGCRYGKFFPNDSIYIYACTGPNPFSYDKYTGRIQPTGIFLNQSQSDDIKLFPNPVSTVLTIELTNTNLWYKQSRVTIKNTLGQIVKTQKLINNQQQMDVGYLPNGIYFMEVTTVKGILSKKIMVSK